jgi:hypothetical protein
MARERANGTPRAFCEENRQALCDAFHCMERAREHANDSLWISDLEYVCVKANVLYGSMSMSTHESACAVQPDLAAGVMLSGTGTHEDIHG